MSDVPENPRERAIWYRGKAEELRQGAKATRTHGLKAVYEAAAASYELLALEAEVVERDASPSNTPVK
jgi:hypothetical protein